MMRRIALGAGVVGLGVGLLAGCTTPAAGPSPTPTPTDSVTPSPSPSVTPSLSAEEQLLAQIPEEAKGDDLLAAVEMAKFFLMLQPDLYRGGDPALWEYLSLPECTFCSSTVTSTGKRVEDGHLQVGGEYSVPEQAVGSVLDTETDDTTTALVQFDFIEAAYEIVAADGSVVKSGGPGTHRATLALRLQDGLWRVYAAATD